VKVSSTKDEPKKRKGKLWNAKCTMEYKRLGPLWRRNVVFQAFAYQVGRLGADKLTNQLCETNVKSTCILTVQIFILQQESFSIMDKPPALSS
jgi:hypothetical protein